MNAAGRLALYGAGLVVAFGGAFGLAGVVVPDRVVESWTQKSGTTDHMKSMQGSGATIGGSTDEAAHMADIKAAGLETANHNRGS